MHEPAFALISYQWEVERAKSVSYGSCWGRGCQADHSRHRRISQTRVHSFRLNIKVDLDKPQLNLRRVLWIVRHRLSKCGPLSQVSCLLSWSQCRVRLLCSLLSSVQQLQFDSCSQTVELKKKNIQLKCGNDFTWIVNFSWWDKTKAVVLLHDTTGLMFVCFFYACTHWSWICEKRLKDWKLISVSWSWISLISLNFVPQDLDRAGGA